VADANGVYCFFEGGNLVALTHDGTVRWERSLVKEFGAFKNHHGLGNSLAQTGTVMFALWTTAGRRTCWRCSR
jgi:outer membrane protein assembly factor BamB